MMHGRHQPLASALRPPITMPPETAIKTAMAAGLGSSLVLLYSLQIHGLSTHILKHAGLSQPLSSPPQLPSRKASVPVYPEIHDDKMGNLLSRERRHSRRSRASSPNEKAPLFPSGNRPAARNRAPSAGPFPQAVRHQRDYYHDKIDPREERYRRPPPSYGTNSGSASRPSTATSFSSSGTFPRTGRPIPSASNPKPWKVKGNGKVDAKPKEYELQICCTSCAGRPNPCGLSMDLNTNAEYKFAYDARNPHYDGNPKTWELRVDLCSSQVERGGRRAKTNDVIRRFVGDKAYGEFGAVKKEKKEPFCMQELEAMLDGEGIPYESNFPR